LIILIVLSKSTNHEALRSAIFSTLQSLHSSSIQTFTYAPCSQTFSVYVPPLISDFKFSSHTKQQAQLWSFII
jgi:hypothetical protein